MIKKFCCCRYFSCHYFNVGPYSVHLKVILSSLLIFLIHVTIFRRTISIIIFFLTRNRMKIKVKRLRGLCPNRMLPQQVPALGLFVEKRHVEVWRLVFTHGGGYKNSFYTIKFCSEVQPVHPSYTTSTSVAIVA